MSGRLPGRSQPARRQARTADSDTASRAPCSRALQVCKALRAVLGAVRRRQPQHMAATRAPYPCACCAGRPGPRPSARPAPRPPAGVGRRPGLQTLTTAPWQQPPRLACGRGWVPGAGAIAAGRSGQSGGPCSRVCNSGAARSPRRSVCPAFLQQAQQSRPCSAACASWAFARLTGGTALPGGAWAQPASEQPRGRQRRSGARHQGQLLGAHAPGLSSTGRCAARGRDRAASTAPQQPSAMANWRAAAALRKGAGL